MSTFIFSFIGSQILSKARLDMANTELDADSIHLVSTFLHAGCYALIRNWIQRDIQKTPKEIAELILNIINKDYL